MRLGVVRGTVTLSLAVPSLSGIRMTILEPVTAGRLADGNPGGGKCLISADQLNAGYGQIVGFAEGRTAASPWYPNDPPVDAYNCLIVENMHYAPPVKAAAPAAEKKEPKGASSKSGASKQKVRS